MNTQMLPVEAVLVAVALGVNPVAPTGELLVFQPPVQLQRRDAVA